MKTGATAGGGRNGFQCPLRRFGPALSAAKAAELEVRRLSLQSARSEVRLLGRLSDLVVVLALALSLANPWMLLQSVAWAGMLVDYSKQVAFTQAVQMTFDGQHPCKLCKEIKSGQASERQQGNETAPAGMDFKLDFPPPSITLIFPPTPGVSPDAPVLPCARCETPPTPPPRLA